MLIGHFERLAPVCPACRAAGTETPLALAVVEAERGGDVEAGILACGGCGAEYPILDGLPVIVPDLPRYAGDNLFYLLARPEIPAAVAGLIGDATGPGTAFDAIRQHLSTYVWDHWGDHDPAEGRAGEDGDGRPGAVARALAAGFDLLGPDLPDGPVLDLGCGTGRSVAELAARTGRPVLGIDLSVPLARFARGALLARRIAYDRRRVGLAYDRRRFAIGQPGGLSWPEGAADVWLCDLLALPFRPGTFALAAGLNVVDCLTDPRAGLAAITAALAPGGGAVLCTPFDWSGNVTPHAAWLGGRSRGESEPEPALARLMAESGALHEVRTGEVPWHVRLHERARVCYRAHLAVARRRADPERSPAQAPA
ncbi:methyltransferase domain-containing protein [Methylobacterium sp. NEAU 140]|uniref:class I SAM-dependent methyltransferase n=1 Tax=Methylobacterium sp. NEAU 140 TaxID=3064945 RepID=UPI00273339E8|nr:methyltransferase domain-containing protein [Methylobacterium sp. NEAU 140]MDP4025132.1 methyltransferase domain-containing protein [Methylobacterium sp. NEAU 140]